MLTISILAVLPLRLLSLIGLVRKTEYEEYEHFWSKKELFHLAKKFNPDMINYSYFNCFGNRNLVLKKK